MRASNRHAEDEAIKARERAARSVTTVVPNLANMLHDDGKPNPDGHGQVQYSNVPAKVPGAMSVAAMAPPPTTLQPSISREEADRLLKEREKQRAPRIAVVPNLANFIENRPSSSSHFTPVGQIRSSEVQTPAVAAVATMPPATQSVFSQQEQDEIMKQRERNARAAAVVPNLANRLGSVGRPTVNGPEPHVMPGAVSVSSSVTTSTIPRSSAHSSEDRDYDIKQQEKKIRAANRQIMANAQNLTQQEKDILQKQRERQSAQMAMAAGSTMVAKSATEKGKSDAYSRPASAGTAQGQSDSDDLLRARFEAATLAMSGNLTQEDRDQLLKNQELQTSLQSYSQHEDKEKSVLEHGSSDLGMNEMRSSNSSGRPQVNVATARRGIAPGALAVTDGISQELIKAPLTRSELSSAPSYVAPMGAVSDTTGPITSDHLEVERTEAIHGAVQPIYQPMPTESDHVYQVQNLVKTEMESNTNSRRKWYMVGAVVLIVIIAIVVGVAVAAGGKSNDTGGADGSSGQESPDAALETERRIALREALVALSVSSLEQLTDPTEAQYQALTWLADEDTDTDIEDTLTMTQRYVLAVYYYSMNGPAWTDSTNWLNPSSNVCEWRGITCLAGEISAITERDPINMDGVLPTELDALSSLTTLFLEKNTVRGLAGPITVLTELALNEANLGEIFKDIPTTILEMTNLQNLFLFGNGLIGTVPTEIEQLSSLVILDLSSNSFSGTLPTQLSSLPYLTDIVVMQNQLSGDVFKVIEGMSNLRAFTGTMNSFTGTIGAEIASLSNLERIELRQNELTGPFPNSFFNISTLGVLDLSNNQLTGTLSSEIGELENLADLYLSDNLISGSIPSELGRAPRLRRFQLERCRMVGVIPTEIGLLPEMMFLQLSTNSFEGPIPTELGNLAKLEILALESNSLTGTIPTQLGQLTLLSDLRLVDNQLSGTLPSEICAIPSLTRIILVSGFPQEGLSCGDCTTCI